MTALLLLLGLGGLLLLGKDAKEAKAKPGQTPPEEQALLMYVDGRKIYRPEARPLVIQALRRFSVDIGDTGDPLMNILKDEQTIVEPGRSAYNAAQLAHSGGFNVWVSPTLMSKSKEDRILYLTSADNPQPPIALDVALLALASEPWPETAQAIPPGPPPSNTPPIPSP